MNTSFILFKLTHDPYGRAPVGVYDYLYQAERAQLIKQQTMAHDCNDRRNAAYGEGQGFGPVRTADEFKNEFSIQEVTTS